MTCLRPHSPAQTRRPRRRHQHSWAHRACQLPVARTRMMRCCNVIAAGASVCLASPTCRC